MDAIAKQMQAEYPKTNAESGVHVRALGETIIGDYRARLFVLLGAVACVLLIACGNVANLLLARGAARAKELAIRSAIGAGRGRIVRHLLTESLVLAFVATAVGLALAWAGIHVLTGAAPATIPRLAGTRIDSWVLAFTLGLAILSSVVFGLVPALKTARGDLQHRCAKAGARPSPARATACARVLVTAEVAIALTLLVGAGLLIRSAIYLNHVSPGFDPSGVISARIAPRPTPYKEGAAEAEQIPRGC